MRSPLMVDVNEMLALFDERFLDVLEKNAPVKTVKIKNRRCPFVSTEIRELMKYRDSILKVARELRNIVKSELREAEREYVRMELERSHNTSSKWKIIRNCIPR